MVRNPPSHFEIRDLGERTRSSGVRSKKGPGVPVRENPPFCGNRDPRGRKKVIVLHRDVVIIPVLFFLFSRDWGSIRLVQY